MRVRKHGTRGGARSRRGALSGVVGTGKSAQGSVTAKGPSSLKPGQERCLVCRSRAAVTTKGRLRKHRDLFGFDCYNTKLPADFDGES